MAERRGGSGDTGIADEDVELAATLMQRGAEAGDAVIVSQVKRHQCGAAAVFSDLLVEFFQAALRPRAGDDIPTGLAKPPPLAIPPPPPPPRHQTHTRTDAA